MGQIKVVNVFINQALSYRSLILIFRLISIKTDFQNFGLLGKVSVPFNRSKYLLLLAHSTSTKYYIFGYDMPMGNFPKAPKLTQTYDESKNKTRTKFITTILNQDSISD